MVPSDNPVPVQQDEPERQVFDTIWTELIALRDRLGQGKDIATGLQDLSSFVARFAFHDPVPVQQEPEDERMDTLLAEMGHERWVDADAWREAADWRDQYRAGRDEVTGLLRAVVSEIDPMELTEMYAYLEADAYLATLDSLAGSESNAAGGSKSRTGDDAEANPPLAATTPDPSVGLRDRLIEAIYMAKVEPSRRPWAVAEIHADACLSVLHEAGTQGDCEHCATRRKDDESLRRRVRERLARIDQDDIEGGYSVVEMATDLERLARVQLSGLCVREGCRAGDDLPAEAGTQDGWLVNSLAVALMTATTEAQEGIKPSDEALRHRDALVRRARAAGEGQRQRRARLESEK